MLARDGAVYLQAGGGIVYDSDEFEGFGVSSWPNVDSRANHWKYCGGHH